MIMPEGQVTSMTCNVEQKVGELRDHFSTELNQPPNVILFLYDGKMSLAVINRSRLNLKFSEP